MRRVKGAVGYGEIVPRERKSRVRRVSQKIQKSEFWNVTYPSGFHRLDEPPEKISAL